MLYMIKIMSLLIKLTQRPMLYPVGIINLCTNIKSFSIAFNGTNALQISQPMAIKQSLINNSHCDLEENDTLLERGVEFYLQWHILRGHALHPYQHTCLHCRLFHWYRGAFDCLVKKICMWWRHCCFWFFKPLSENFWTLNNRITMISQKAE